LGRPDRGANADNARGFGDMKNQRDALINSIYEVAKNDKDVYILSADFGAPALDRFRVDLSDQFFNLGISEQNLIDVAIGMALKGKKIFTYAMAPFISLRCAEQHKLAAMMDLPIVNIIAGVGLGYANAGPTHYATEDYSVAVNTIKSSVYTMSDASQSSGFVAHYFNKPHFCFLRLDRAPVDDLTPKSDFDKGFRVLSSGEKICVVTHGYMVNKMFSLIETEGLIGEIALVDLFSSKPIPKEFLDYVKSFNKLVFVDEQIETSSLGAFLIPKLLRAGAEVKIENICLIEEFMFENVGRDKLVELAGINKENLLRSIEIPT
jgi:transketolase